MDDTTTKMSAAPARCDDYEDYLEETRGYAYDARDIVSIEKLRRHDALREDPAEAFEDFGTNLGELDDFERLGAARGWLEAGNHEQFWEAIHPVLEEPFETTGVDYPDVHLWVAEVLAAADKYEEARNLLDAFANRWPDDPRGPQLDARLTVETEGFEPARETYEALLEEFGRDVELMFEFAEDLHRVGADDAALDWVERARERAEEVGDRAVLVDLELLENELREASSS